jgi:type II restriction enzyme
MCLPLEENSMRKRKSSFLCFQSAEDLLTPYANTRASFVQMALEKSRRASPFVAEARDLAEQANRVKTPYDLTSNTKIRGALLTAAGISEKAAGHFDPLTYDETIKKFVENYLIPAADSFREELVYRFLLTRGDSLGGAMRNVVGTIAQRRFVEMLIARLRNAGIPFFYGTSISKNWLPATGNIAAHVEEIKSLAWKDRAILFNRTIPIVKKNIDMSLLAYSGEDFSKDKDILGDPSRFLALGELKGGIDPAGADEHWKTACAALDRIRTGFAKANCVPALFFIGAAIEQAMAQEIWNWLNDGKLDNAANLTVDAHLSALCDWIVTL